MLGNGVEVCKIAPHMKRFEVGKCRQCQCYSFLSGSVKIVVLKQELKSTIPHNPLHWGVRDLSYSRGLCFACAIATTSI